MKKNTPAKDIFKLMKKNGSRQITFHYDPKTDLKIIWAIDSFPEKRDKSKKITSELSVSGGTRFAHKDEDIALNDAMNLSKAMTRKANVLSIKEGGSKAVVLANQEKNNKLLNSIGDFIQIHKGLFKTAIDLGFIKQDGKQISTRTDYIDSLSHLEKGLGSTGETTSQGMIFGFEVICKEILKKPLKDCVIAVQGLGAVGLSLCKKLTLIGCKVIGFDINPDYCKKAKKIGVQIVSKNTILTQKVDILSPCAYGGIINKTNISKLKCKVIAGGANNQLKDEIKDEKLLLKNNIIYIPDFVINSGGFLQAIVERQGGTIYQAKEKSIIVGEKIKQIISYSKKEKMTLLESAKKMFENL